MKRIKLSARLKLEAEDAKELESYIKWLEERIDNQEITIDRLIEVAYPDALLIPKELEDRHKGRETNINSGGMLH